MVSVRGSGLEPPPLINNLGKSSVALPPGVPAQPMLELPRRLDESRIGMANPFAPPAQGFAPPAQGFAPTAVSPAFAPPAQPFPPQPQGFAPQQPFVAPAPQQPFAPPAPGYAPPAQASAPPQQPQAFSPVPVSRSPVPRLDSPAPAPQQGGASRHQVRNLLGLRSLSSPPGAAPAPQQGAPPQHVAPPQRVLQHQHAPEPQRAPAPHQHPPSALMSRGLGADPRMPAPPRDLGQVPGLPDLPNLPKLRDSAPAPHHSPSQAPRGPNYARGFGRASLFRTNVGERRSGLVLALGALALVLFLGLVVAGAVLLSRRDDRVAAGPAGTGSAIAPPGGSGTSSALAANTSSALPRSRLLTEDERFRSLLAQVHGRGKESGALRLLLDEEASLVAQAMSPEACVGPQCAALRQLNQLVGSKETRKLGQRHAHAPDSLRSKWLAGYEMPEIPVEDDPRVQRRFEYYTANPVGREQFQQMLFRCGAFHDSIQALLVRRGMPTSLLAVVFAESSCSPGVESPVGAAGLWQFMPEAGRAYGLRVIPNMVDERHSPDKSTEAAVRYLSDLYAKLGSWDLVFAAYNMGAFGLLTRMARIEADDVGFWDLADAELLPDETVFYVPNIEAIALILSNLQRLKFTGQVAAPEMTAELTVPPATRLSLVARAAAMSLAELHRLNPDLLTDVTPNVQNFVVEIPKDNIWQARETLDELIKAHDDGDLCVPASFDWGRQRFTPERAQACRPAAGRPAPSSSSTPAARASAP
jgi:hypothetical protein